MLLKKILQLFFPQKSDAELAMNALKNASKHVGKLPGGCVGICTEFVKFTGTNEMYKEVHLIHQDELRLSKLNVTCAGVMLLTALKNGVFKGKDEGFIMDLAKFSFIQSTVILTTEELREIFSTSPEQMTSKRDELINQGAEAWEMWLSTELSVLNKCFPL